MNLFRDISNGIRQAFEYLVSVISLPLIIIVLSMLVFKLIFFGLWGSNDSQGTEIHKRVWENRDSKILPGGTISNYLLVPVHSCLSNFDGHQKEGVVIISKESKRREKLQEQFKSILSNSSRKKIEGIEIDSWSAGIINSVLKGLNEDSKATLLDKPIKQIFSICFAVSQGETKWISQLHCYSFILCWCLCGLRGHSTILSRIETNRNKLCHDNSWLDWL